MGLTGLASTQSSVEQVLERGRISEKMNDTSLVTLEKKYIGLTFQITFQNEKHKYHRLLQNQI